MKILQACILVKAVVVLAACQSPEQINETAVSDSHRRGDVSRDLPDGVKQELEASGLTGYMLRGARWDKGTVTVFVDSSTGSYAARMNWNDPELAEAIVARGSLEELASQLESVELVRFSVIAAHQTDSSASNLRPLTPEEVASLRRRLAR